MEMLALIAGIAVLVTLLITWINFFKLWSVEREVKLLKEEVANISLHLVNQPKTPAELVHSDGIIGDETVEIAEENIDYYDDVITEIVKEHKPYGYTSPSPRVNDTPKKQVSFEQNIATKLPVWIGAISLILAAFFLVKYSIELGWMQPAVRVSFGAIFGIGLIITGQFIFRSHNVANNERIAQAMVGAGIVTLYVSIYAALNLFALLPSFMAFALMIGVTATAVILSLMHGQVIAVFGLIGGLLTPALIGADEPNVTALFTYLFLLFSGMLFVLVRKDWWILAIISVIGVFSWSFFWLFNVRSLGDLDVFVIFAMLMTAVVVGVTGAKIVGNKADEEFEKTFHTMNFITLGGSVLSILFISTIEKLSLFDWAMFGILNIVVMAFAYFRPMQYHKIVAGMLGLSLILLFGWLPKMADDMAMIVIVGLAVLYIGGGAIFMRKQGYPVFWSVIQIVTGLSLYALSYHEITLPEFMAENVVMFWGLLGMLFAGVAAYQAWDVRAHFQLDNKVMDQLTALYALAASTFVTLGFIFALPWVTLPIAIAIQIVGTAFVYQKTRVEFLKKITLLLTLVMATMHYNQFVLFTDMILASLNGRVLQTYVVINYFTDEPLLRVGLPCILLSIAFWMFYKNRKMSKELFHVMFGTILFLAWVTIYYLYGSYVHGDYANAIIAQASFMERAYLTTAFALTGLGCFVIYKKWNVTYLKPWIICMVAIANFRYIYFDYMIHNPYFVHGQYVGYWNIPLINGVTLVYGFSILFWAVLAYWNTGSIQKVFYKVLSFTSLFTFVTFTVMQTFRGDRMNWPSSYIYTDTEFYSYSVAWLLTGLSLLAVGIKFHNKTFRIASLAFIVLAVLKVFIFDAAQLEGLYRVFSFLGLGISLIGLSVFYTRFVFGVKKVE